MCNVAYRFLHHNKISRQSRIQETNKASDEDIKLLQIRDNIGHTIKIGILL